MQAEVHPTETSRPDGHPHNTTLGRRGEQIAVDWLTHHGFTVVERNWRCRSGEIDVIAWDGPDLVFVEVKTRAGTTGGHPLEAITPRKLRRLRLLAAAWCTEHEHRRAEGLRIDAVAVHVDDRAGRVAVEHVRSVS